MSLDENTFWSAIPDELAELIYSGNIEEENGFDNQSCIFLFVCYIMIFAGRTAESSGGNFYKGQKRKLHLEFLENGGKSRKFGKKMVLSQQKEIKEIVGFYIDCGA